MIKRILGIGSVAIVIFLFVVQFGISDASIYSKKGKKSFVYSISEMLDFLNSPLETSDNYSLEKASVRIEGEKGYFTYEDKEFKFSIEKIDEGKKKFEVKFSKNDYLNRGREFKFRSFGSKPTLAPLYSTILGEELGLIHQKYALWNLEMNDVVEPYVSREAYSKYLIERQNVSNGTFFELRLKKDEFKVKKVVGEHEEAEAFINDRASVLHQAITQNDTLVLHELFDLDYLSRYFLFTQLTGDFDSKKLKMVYRLTNGKFYPFAYEHSDYKNNKLRKNKFLKDRFWSWAFSSNSFKNAVLENKNKLEANSNIIARIDQITNDLSGGLSHVETKYSQRELNYRLLESSKVFKANFENIITNSFSIDDNPLAVLTNVQEFMFLHEFKGIESELISIGFEQLGDAFTLKGKGHVKKNIVVPSGYKLIFEPKSELFIDSAVNFLTYSQIEIKGKKNAPVKIFGKNGKEYGIFGVIGDDKNYSTINYLEVSGGTEAKFNGVYMSGGFNIYHQNVVLKNTKVFGHRADDGLNIKYGKIHIDSCHFYENFADQVDLDFCFGILENSSFDNNAGDSNGDGLDFSGSEIIVSTCSFNEFSDKGISVGENTKAIVRNNQFNNNTLGMAIKDLSQITLIDNTFNNNKTAVSLYQKKPLFGGGTLYLCENTMNGNEKETEIDSLSVIHEGCSEENLNLISVKAFVP